MRPVFCLAILVLVLGQLNTANSQLQTFYTSEFSAYSIEEQTIYAVFTVQAPLRPTEQAALSLTTVLDTSGSMEGTPIQLLKRTAQFLVGKLLETSGVHSLGLIGYNTRVDELSEVVTVDDTTASSLVAAIERVVAQGATFLSGGLEDGVLQQSSAGGEKVKNVYLFTDGIPTVGPTSISEILDELNSVLAQTNELITISTFGFGNNLDVALLSSIAEVGGGETYIITREEDIPAAFGKALGGLLSIIASQIEVILRPLPGCRITSTLSGGVASDAEGTYTIRFENLFANEFRDILIEIELAVGEPGPQQCVEATVSFLDTATNERLITEPEILQIRRLGEVEEEPPPDVRIEENRLKFATADALAEAQASISQGDTEGAAQAIAVAQASVEVSVLVDTPEIQALSNDINRMLELLEESQDNQIAQAARISELETALRQQRSTSTGGDFETAREVETEEQQAIQQETQQAVLSETPVGNVAPATEEVMPDVPQTEPLVTGQITPAGEIVPTDPSSAPVPGMEEAVGPVISAEPPIGEVVIAPETESLVLPVSPTVGTSPPDTAVTLPGSETPVAESAVVPVPASESLSVQPTALEAVTLQAPAEESAVAQLPAQETVGTVPPAAETTTAQLPAEETTVVQPPTQETVGTLPPAAETTTTQLPAEETTVVQPPAQETVGTLPPAAETTTTQLPAEETTVVQPPAQETVGTLPPTSETTAVPSPITGE